MPIFIPLLLIAAGGAAGGVIGRAVGKKREETLEEALIETVATTPTGALPPKAEAVLPPEISARVRARAVGIRTGVAEKAVAKGIEKQAELTPGPSARKLAALGLTTPMIRLGGW